MALANSKGRIVNGKNKGWYIWIKDDQENTGGYLVIQSQKPDFGGDGFDNWFETMEEIERFFQYKSWYIDWFE
ncbi:hypothetical protein [Pectinatus frisingensis]|jgi:hypothetical protein|uniref:hypothetical protein n=1 Tax=Pectinatus frisingensis TaxID=865 RepID=UPI0015F42967|nr:hypothetical protein [Pectinatus frisingensis]